jgi:hypothetical protein
MLFGAFALYAENPFAGKRLCLFPLVDLSTAASQDSRVKSLSQEIALELQAEDIALVGDDQVQTAMQSLPPDGLLDPQSAISAAETTGADVAVSGYASMKDDRILVALSCFDVKTKAIVAGFLRSFRVNLVLYNSLHSAVSEMIGSARFPSSASSPIPVEESPFSLITFTSSQDGMEVLIGGDASAGVIENGSLVFPALGLARGDPLIVEKRMPGYHSAAQTVHAAETVPLSPLVRESSFAVGLDVTLGQLMGLGTSARIFFIPDSVFVQPSLFFSLQPPFMPAGNTALHFDCALALGFYIFFPPDSPFRLGVALGFGGIFSTVLGTALPLFIDPYLDLFSYWIEWNFPSLSLFLRVDMKYALGGAGPNLLGIGMITWGGWIPPIGLGVAFRW